ncbi:MAG: undecaprenyl-diphosphatase [Candidatus Nanohaloarchaea archaeon]|jgi:undecaprenyl-diphosphatase
MSSISGIDTQLFLFVQSFTGNRVVDTFFLMCAELLVFLIPTVLVYLWFRSEEARRDSVFTFLTAVAGISLTYGLGLLYFHHQPFSTYNTIVSGGELDNAFPSQHTASMFSVFWSFLYLKRRKLAWIFGVSGVLTGFGRVFVGLHYPLDILGGVVSGLLGLVVAVAVYRYLDSWVDRLIDLSYRVEELIRSWLRNI